LKIGKISTRNICIRPLFFSPCALALGTWRARASSRLEINLSNLPGHTEANL
jgi:hypothetical protein